MLVCMIFSSCSNVSESMYILMHVLLCCWVCGRCWIMCLCLLIVPLWGLPLRNVKKKFLSFCSDAVEISIHLRCSTMSLGGWCSAFQGNIVISSSGVKCIEGGTTVLSWNVRHQSPSDKAPHPRRMEMLNMKKPWKLIMVAGCKGYVLVFLNMQQEEQPLRQTVLHGEMCCWDV